MANPLVSVIVAVKNGERFLASAINSVLLEQDYRPIEMIVVDGQSTDRTAQIAQSFAQVRYIHQVNKGVFDAYNVGIDAAKGELVAFLSRDDLWTPDKLSVQVSYLMDHPKIQYTIAKAKFFLEPGHSPPSGLWPGIGEE
jgi:glycosyltransferase involved in cell wall biosynthesis